MGTRLHLIIPNGTWGYFILRPNEKLSQGGTREIRVPADGIGAEVPENPYSFSVQFANGTPIPSLEDDSNQSWEAGHVTFQWPQMSDTRGYAFFVGTKKQFESTYVQNPPLGMKPMK